MLNKVALWSRGRVDGSRSGGLGFDPHVWPNYHILDGCIRITSEQRPITRSWLIHPMTYRLTLNTSRKVWWSDIKKQSNKQKLLLSKYCKMLMNFAHLKHQNVQALLRKQCLLKFMFTVLFNLAHGAKFANIIIIISHHFLYCYVKTSLWFLYKALLWKRVVLLDSSSSVDFF